MKPEIIEKREVRHAYGLTGTEAIIDHPKHGRLLLCQGYGGEQSPSGGAVRWRHGRVVQMKEGDTFAYLAGEWDKYTLRHVAVLHGYDEERPNLEWDGFAIAKLAESLGL